ncbi:MAG TPA: tRNA uridine-5-carboxymethylaminomethyl(34) synthesis GTPase MnmE [Stellaceae bacterium]|nr:tRNA uridine-5-carboxymethylaminomethyl(34) synthesis GTPase MnmE [Stellaceae bacterium]
MSEGSAPPVPTPPAFAETIFAPATAPGRAAIAIVRISGPAAGQALIALIGTLPQPRRARHARLCDPGSGAPIDDGIALWFPAPHSVTGEDIAELQIHGSRAVIAALTDVLRRLGLRLAEPGEFTRRAFFNHKLDLVQAEAIADLTAAETEVQRRQALRQLDGELGTIYHGWSARLLHVLAHLEAAIDFPDEDLPLAIDAEVGAETAALVAEIDTHLVDGRRGERLREGITIAIVGPPNAGKSSLLNALSQREAAITSPIAGTTRDVIEVAIDLAGFPVVLADTAGLRESADIVEQEGLRRAVARAETAEMRLFVFDARRPEDAVGASAWPGRDTLLVANKIDLANDPALPHGALPVSALTGVGLGDLVATLAGRVAADYDTAAPLLTRARHRASLEDTREALGRSLAASDPELRAEDLRIAWRSLGRITGSVDVEDLLDVIFADFCIGK